MAAARKPADAEPAATEPESAPAEAAESEAQVAEETPAAAEASAVEEFRPPEQVTFIGFAQSSVALIGLCDPGETYTVPATVADAVCAGDSPQFTRTASA